MKRFLNPIAFLILAMPAAAFARQQAGSAIKIRENRPPMPASALAREKAAIKVRENRPPIPATALAREQAGSAIKIRENREQSMLARVTVYWARGGSGSDRFTRQHKCATGIRLRSGHCAVDPRRIPYGSQVIFPDGRFVAVDTGTAVINRKAARLSGRTRAEQNAPVIDRFFENKAQAERWEKTHPPFMTVRVIAPNYRPYAQRLVETKFPRAIPVDQKSPKAILADNKYPRATLVVKK